MVCPSLTSVFEAHRWMHTALFMLNGAKLNIPIGGSLDECILRSTAIHTGAKTPYPRTAPTSVASNFLVLTAPITLVIPGKVNHDLARAVTGDDNEALNSTYHCSNSTRLPPPR
ncbi:hypothetical protein J3458_012837 [Metarhizium acridum]|uniref:uncharacterized protein n=1 Tax=Metarhizium acridum TaxID=92637 RepID=UPI001C6B7CD1|nr:hypothetical protein J3458_012837 [Metarhizium acridum]